MDKIFNAIKFRQQSQHITYSFQWNLWDHQPQHAQSVIYWQFLVQYCLVRLWLLLSTGRGGSFPKDALLSKKCNLLAFQAQGLFCLLFWGSPAIYNWHSSCCFEFIQIRAHCPWRYRCLSVSFQLRTDILWVLSGQLDQNSFCVPLYLPWESSARFAGIWRALLTI